MLPHSLQTQIPKWKTRTHTDTAHTVVKKSKSWKEGGCHWRKYVLTQLQSATSQMKLSLSGCGLSIIPWPCLTNQHTLQVLPMQIHKHSNQREIESERKKKLTWKLTELLHISFFPLENYLKIRNAILLAESINALRTVKFLHSWVSCWRAVAFIGVNSATGMYLKIAGRRAGIWLEEDWVCISGSVWSYIRSRAVTARGPDCQHTKSPWHSQAVRGVFYLSQTSQETNICHMDIVSKSLF